MKKNNIRISIKIVITVIFIIVILRKIDVYVMIENFKGYPARNFIAALFLGFLVNLIGAFSLNAVFPKENVFSIFLVALKTNFYAIILPGQLLGESTKIFLLSKEKSVMSERVSAVVVDKILNVIAMILVGGMGLFLSPNIQDASLRNWLGAGLVLMSVVLLILKNKKLLYSIWNQMKNIVRKDKWVKKGEEYLDIWLEYSNRNCRLVASTFWGIVYQLIISLFYYVLGLGLEIDISFWDYCWVNAILTVILFLPVSIGGLGVREATLTGFLGELGVSAEKAVTLSVFILAIQLLRALVGGGMLLLERGSDSHEEDIDIKL